MTRRGQRGNSTKFGFLCAKEAAFSRPFGTRAPTFPAVLQPVPFKEQSFQQPAKARLILFSLPQSLSYLLIHLVFQHQRPRVDP
jgi:hypothetical protein